MLGAASAVGRPVAITAPPAYGLVAAMNPFAQRLRSGGAFLLPTLKCNHCDGATHSSGSSA
jgi:hypothetical protein